MTAQPRAAAERPAGLRAPGGGAARFLARHERAALAGLLLFALGLRCLVVFGEVAVLQADEIFQYLEQGHRLAFNRGVVPWEYDYGIRSWLVPSAVAVVMKASSWFSASPLAYIRTLRFLAACASLVPVWFGFLLARAKAGPAWALIAALFCSAWYHAVFVSPSLLTDVLSAYLMFPAIWLASDPAGDSRRASIALGLLLGLAFCLRIQMAPALLAIACWHCRLDYREKWLRVCLAASAVVFVAGGLLDWVTLGLPFQSIWLNFSLNALHGVSASFGGDPWYGYVTYIAPRGAIVVLLPLFCLALAGAVRAPLLALTALLVLVSHSFIAHKEYRFIAFFLLALPILIALGAAALAERVGECAGPRAAAALVATVILYLPFVSWLEWPRTEQDDRLTNSGVLRAFLAAHDRKDLCALGVADHYWTLTGGYTYLDRNVPLYYSRDLAQGAKPLFYQRQNGILGDGSVRIPVQMHVVLNGSAIAQMPGDVLLANTKAFNSVIAAKGHTVAGYSTEACFANEKGSPWPAACLLVRKGGCSRN